MKQQPSIQERLQAGDETVLALLNENQGLGLYRALRLDGFVRDIHEFNLLLNDALLDVWNKRSTFTSSGAIYSHINTYVRYKAIDAYRAATGKKKPRITHMPMEEIAEMEPATPTVLDQAEYQRALKLVYEELYRLKRRAGQVMQRHYIGNMSFQAIAIELGIDASTVRNVHKRAVAQLRARVSPAISPAMLEALLKVAFTFALLSLLFPEKKLEHFVDASPVLTIMPVSSQNLIYGNRP